MRKPIVATVVACTLGVLTACAHDPGLQAVQAPPDPAATVAVPHEQNALADQLRNALSARGWTLTNYDASTLQAQAGYAELARRARYRLTLSADRIGYCRGGQPSFLFNTALVENATGAVPVAMTGAHCLTTAKREFDAALDRHRIRAPQTSVSASR